MKPQRIVMQQEGASPGSGAPPTSAPAPTDPPAQGGAPQLDVKAIAAEVRDSLFAELRRSGVLGKEKPAAKPAETPPAPQPDLSQLRALDRAVARSPHAARLSDAAYKRLERAFVDEAPSDAASWLSEYFEGIGLGAAPQSATPTPATTATTAAPAPRSAVPISSGGGSPPAPQVPLEERDLLSLTPTDRDHLIRQKGARWYMSKLAEQTKDKSVRIR